MIRWQKTGARVWFPQMRGFTLVEMMVTLSLLGILALAVLPLAQLSAKHQKEQELSRSLREIREALDAWKSAVESGRIDSAMTISGYPPSLEVLVEGVVDRHANDGRLLRFLRRIPRNPYSSPGTDPAKSWGLRSYASSSDRPEAGQDVYDVYSTSVEIGSDGRPYSQW